MKKNWGRLLLVTLFAVAMGYLEASVVVYLRKTISPQQITPAYDMTPHTILDMIPHTILATERAREASTIIMLLTFAILSGRNFAERFSFFLWTFGVWDIFYYVFLYVLIKWPPSLRTIDCLFLIPSPWIAPVYLPVLASLLMLIISAGILSHSWEKKK